MSDGVEVTITVNPKRRPMSAERIAKRRFAFSHWASRQSMSRRIRGCGCPTCTFDLMGIAHGAPRPCQHADMMERIDASTLAILDGRVPMTLGDFA